MRLSLNCLIGLVLVVAFLGCEDQSDPLFERLKNTKWVMDRVEVYDQTGVLIETFRSEKSTPSSPNGRCAAIVLNFRDDGRMVIGRDCSDAGSGCGDFRVKDGKLSLVIFEGQIVTGLCAASNFISVHQLSDEPVAVVNEVLQVGGYSAAFSRLLLEPNWAELQADERNGRISIKSFYVTTPRSLTNDMSCCARFSLNGFRP